MADDAMSLPPRSEEQERREDPSSERVFGEDRGGYPQDSYHSGTNRWDAGDLPRSQEGPNFSAVESYHISSDPEPSPSGACLQLDESQNHPQALDGATLNLGGRRSIYLQWNLFSDQLQEFRNILTLGPSNLETKVIDSNWPTICLDDYKLDCNNEVAAMFSRIQKYLVAVQFDKKVNER